MKHFITIAFFLILVVSACASPTPTPTPRPTATEAPYAISKVTKSTGLYASPNVNAELLKALPVGTLIKPESGAKYYDECKNITDLGETYSVCHVEVISTGEKVGCCSNGLRDNSLAPRHLHD